MTAGVCRYCVCTDDHGCADGCSWVEETHTICSLCREAEEVASTVVAVFGRVAPRARPPIALPAPEWIDLTFDQQQLLVMAHRRTVEQTRALLIEEIAEDAVDAMVSLNQIAQFLAQHGPQYLEDDQPLHEVVIRLLLPHLGARIVLTGQAART